MENKNSNWEENLSRNHKLSFFIDYVRLILVSSLYFNPNCFSSLGGRIRIMKILVKKSLWQKFLDAKNSFQFYKQKKLLILVPSKKIISTKILLEKILPKWNLIARWRSKINVRGERKKIPGMLGKEHEQKNTQNFKTTTKFE